MREELAENCISGWSSLALSLSLVVCSFYSVALPEYFLFYYTKLTGFDFSLASVLLLFLAVFFFLSFCTHHHHMCAAAAELCLVLGHWLLIYLRKYSSFGFCCARVRRDISKVINLYTKCI